MRSNIDIAALAIHLSYKQCVTGRLRAEVASGFSRTGGVADVASGFSRTTRRRWCLGTIGTREPAVEFPVPASRSAGTPIAIGASDRSPLTCERHAAAANY
jgi:hypothetical protein